MQFLPALLAAPNILFVDSSFAPIKGKDFSIDPEGVCAWMSEKPDLLLPLQGECYDHKLWNDVSSEDKKRLEGMLDAMAGRKTSRSEEWLQLESSHPAETQRVKSNYILSVHGSRAAYLAHRASEGKARPLFLRSLSSQAGSLQTASHVPARTSQFQRYKNGCTLVNWTPSQEADLRNTGLLDYQERISSLLKSNPQIKVINISLGYKESWILEDSQNCTAPQVRREFEILQATWLRLFRSFPDRIFVVAAGNESENFDRADLLSRDLWASLVDADNLILVGAMRGDGRRLPSSNHGLAVEVFALGDDIPTRTPFPGLDLGYETLVSGTSYSAPIVSGQLLSLMLKNPKASVAEMKSQIVSRLRETRRDLIFKSFEKYCKGKSFLNECLDVIVDLISNPLLWRPTFEFYLQGRNAWGFAPLALQFQEDLPVLGQTKLMFIDGNLTPALLLKPTDNPWELLITIHHEIFHFAKMDQAAKEFSNSQRLNNCVTPYQLMLLRDELPAYKEELEFYKASPPWFRKKLGNKKLKSILFGSSLSYKDFYKKLEAELQVNPNFIYQKYIELGHYPSCALDLIKAESTLSK
jgi:hypothetical protein